MKGAVYTKYLILVAWLPQSVDKPLQVLIAESMLPNIHG